MTDEWSQLSKTTEFNNLPAEKREKVRTGYFDKYIAPKVKQPEKLPEYRAAWDAKTLPKPAANPAGSLIPKPEAEKEKDGAFGYSWDQAQKLGGRGIQSAGELVGSERIADFGKGVVEQQEKDIEEGGYQPKYTGSFRETLQNDGVGAALGWTGEKLAENSVYTGVSLATGAAALATAPFSVPAALAITAAGTGASGLMILGETAGEMEEKGVEVNNELAAATAVAATILDRIGVGKVLPKAKLNELYKNLDKMTGDELVGELRKNGAKEAADKVEQEILKGASAAKDGIAKKAAKGFAWEGATESGQEALMMSAAAYQGGEYEPMEVVDRFIDSTILGGTMGAGFSQVSSGYTPEQERSRLLQNPDANPAQRLQAAKIKAAEVGKGNPALGAVFLNHAAKRIMQKKPLLNDGESFYESIRPIERHELDQEIKKQAEVLALPHPKDMTHAPIPAEDPTKRKPVFGDGIDQAAPFSLRREDMNLPTITTRLKGAKDRLSEMMQSGSDPAEMKKAVRETRVWLDALEHVRAGRIEEAEALLGEQERQAVKQFEEYEQSQNEVIASDRNDRRMKGLELLSQELLSKREGNNALVPDPNWVRGESDIGDAPMIRSSSVNPAWFQENSDMKSVDYVRNTVAKAVAGEKLGANEQRVIDAMIEEVDFRNGDEDVRAALDLENDAAFDSFLTPDESELVADYPPQARALQALYDRAIAAGMQESEVDSIIESNPEMNDNELAGAIYAEIGSYKQNISKNNQGRGGENTGAQGETGWAERTGQPAESRTDQETGRQEQQLNQEVKDERAGQPATESNDGQRSLPVSDGVVQPGRAGTDTVGAGQDAGVSGGTTDPAVADAEGYRQRTEQRKQAVQRTDSPEAIDQILSEHAQDPAGHLDGYEAVNRVAKDRKQELENPPEPGIVFYGTERSAGLEADRLKRENPEKTYRVEARAGSFGVEYVVIDDSLNSPNQTPEAQQPEALTLNQEQDGTTPQETDPNAETRAQVNRERDFFGLNTPEGNTSNVGMGGRQDDMVGAGSRSESTESEQQTGLTSAGDTQTSENTEQALIGYSENHPKWAVDHELSTGGKVVYSDSDVALIEGFALLTGTPVYAGIKGDKRTQIDINSYKGNLFSEKEKKRLIDAKETHTADMKEKYNKNPNGPFKDDRVVGSTGTPENLVNVAKEWIKMLGINSRVFISTTDDARNYESAEKYNLYGPYAAIRSAGIDKNEGGSTRRLSNGDHYIALNIKGRMSENLETLAHEIGHIFEKEEWGKADSDTRTAVMESYRKWIDGANKTKAKDWVRGLRPHVVGKTTLAPDVMASDLPPYWRSFSEWFADQVARWAVSENEPRTAVEKFFARIGRGLQRLYASVAGKDSLPNQAMRDYLNSRVQTFSPDQQQARRDDTQRDIYQDRIDNIDDPAELREYVKDLRADAMTDERTGLGSNRAWIQRGQKAYTASVDLDSLKWVNDNLGHAAGDQMIELAGEALRRAGFEGDAFHVSGDEFYVQANSADKLNAGLRIARNWLGNQTVGEGDNAVSPGFSYGIGQDLTTAEQELNNDKARREETGERAARGERPGGPAVGRGQDRGPGEAETDGQATAQDRQGEGAERSESGQQNTATDEFVKAPDGSLDFGEISEEIAKVIGRQPGKIRLPVGIHRDDGTGYGLIHIQKNHSDQIKAQGFKRVEDYVLNLAAGFTEVWKAKGRQLLVTVRDGKKDVMYVQLEPAEDGDYYRVNSAFPVRQKDYPERHSFVKLWDGSESPSIATGLQSGFADDSLNKPSGVAPNAPGKSTDSIVQPQDINQAANEAATSSTNDTPAPTDEQKAAGNYKKGHFAWNGLNITIENPKDSTRSGTDDNGNAWSNTMQAHYGYLKLTQGADGENVDVFFGPNEESEKVYVIDQRRDKGNRGPFDEHKVMLGFNNKMDAVNAYKGSYQKGWGVAKTSTLTMDELKSWLAEGDLKKPYSGQSDPAADSTTTKGTKLADPAAEQFEDFGEKIEGAKKHTASLREALSDDVDVAALPLSKSFPKPDYEKLADSGVAPETLFLVAYLRNQIPSKPRRSNRVSAWAKKVESIRSFASDLLSGEVSAGQTITEISKIDSSQSGLKDLAALAGEVLPSQIESLAPYSMRKEFFSLFRGEENVTKWTATDNKSGGGFGRMGNQAHFDTKDEALAYIKSKVTVSDDAGKPLAKFDMWTERGKDGFFVGKKVGPGKFIELAKFDSKKEAKEYIVSNNDELSELLKNKKKIGSMRRAEQNERIGKDYRRGENVTSALFEETFGFRGVQFGNYVENDRRQQDLNNAYDGLLDLAGVLGIPPKAISLNGELGLAFGARGVGGKDAAAAHYESGDSVAAGNVVINLTKKDGPGSLAHEWWHALDNYFARMGEMRAPKQDGSYLTELNRPSRQRVVENGQTKFVEVDPAEFGVRPEVYESFKNLTRIIRAETDLVERSTALDGRKTKDYWATDRELSARAFERYVIDKLAADGYESDYLATLLPKDAWDANEALFGNTGETYPYPTDKEAKVTNAAYQRIFDTLKTKETESGVALFREPGRRGAVSVHDANEVASGIKAGWSSGARSRVAVSATFADLPSDVQQAAKESGGNEYVRGVFHKGKFHLIAENHTSLQDVEETMFHEAYGHLGLNELFGKDVRTKMNDLFMATGGAKGLNAMAEKHGVNLTKYAQRLSAMQRDGKITAEVRNAVMMEELLSHMAEDQRPTVSRRAKEIIGMIRQWLREHGYNILGKVSDSELSYLLKQSRDVVIRGVNNDGFYIGDGTALFRTERTKSTYETRIDEIFSGSPRNRKGVKVLDRADILDLLGHGDKPLHLIESAVGKKRSSGEAAHPGMTAEQWKRVPEWIENPAAVFESGTVDGRMTMVAPELVDGKPVLIILEPNGMAGGLDAHVLVNAYEKDSPSRVPTKDWVKEQKLLYLDQKRSPEISDRSGLQLPRDVRQLRGYKHRVVTDADLVKYRQSDDAMPGGMMRTADEEVFEKIGLGKKEAVSLADKVRALKGESWNKAMKAFGNASYERALDGLIGIRWAEDAVGKGVAAGDYAGSGYVGVRLATGVADVMHAVMHRGAPEWRDGVLAHREGTEGLLDVFSELGKDLDNWLGWMAGNRAEELMATGRENNLTQDDVDSLKALSEGKEELFNRIKDKYGQLNKAMLDVAQEAGLINPASRAEWESEWYVPFYRRSEADGNLALLAPRTKRGLSHQTAGIKKLKGGEAATNDLLENILTNWMKMVDASMKNSALIKTVDNLADSDYISDESVRWQQVVVSKSEIAKRIKSDRKTMAAVADFLGLDAGAPLDQVANELEKVDTEGFEKLWGPVAPTDPDVIRIQRNGKNEYYRVNDKPLLRAITHLGNDGFNDPVTRGARFFKRLLTTGVTSSPDFILRNFVRDAAHAWAINPDGFKFGVDSMKGLKGALSQDADYWIPMFAGASFQGGYVHGTDPEASAQIMRRALEARGLTRNEADAHAMTVVNSPEKMKGMLKMAWQKYRQLGDKVENANRLSTYRAAAASGKGLAQAVFESKDLMDYSLRGNFQAVVWLTDVVPFLNARLQGLSKLGRAGKANPVEVGMALGKIGMFSVALAMLNDDDEKYQGLPDWEKDAYWHIFLGEEHFRIPKPFEIGIIGGTIPERIYHTWVADNQPDEKLLMALKHGVFDTLGFNPLPQALLPVIEVWGNRSFFFDTPIEGMSDRNRLPEDRYNAYTSTSMVQVGQVLGVSPKKLQHLWEGYTGTMGAYALSTADMMTRAVQTGDAPRPEWSVSDLPVAKSFYRGAAPARSTQYATDLYDRLEEVNQIYSSIRDKMEWDPEAANKMLEENKDKIGYRKTLNTVSKRLSKLRNQKSMIMNDPKMSPRAKRDMLNGINAQINKLTKMASETTQEAF